MSSKATALLGIISFWVICFGIGYGVGHLDDAKSTTSTGVLGTSIVDAAEPEPTIEVDRTAPNILHTDSASSTFKDTKEFNFTVDEPVEITSNYPIEQELTSSTSTGYKYLVTVNELITGDNNIILSMKDTVGNTTQHQITVSKQNFDQCFDPQRPITAVTDPTSFESIVDKHFKLPEHYRPDDLVNAGAYGVPTMQNGSSYVRLDVFNPLLEMSNAMKADGISFVVSSGYRRYEAQVAAYAMWASIVGSVNANSYAALPGHSEHQHGTALDFMTAENGYSVNSATHEQTALSRWLVDHAHEYGFVISYPKGYSHITGYEYEPWHYRYVGVEAATEIKTNNITLTEYLYTLHNIPCRNP